MWRLLSILFFFSFAACNQNATKSEVSAITDGKNTIALVPFVEADDSIYNSYGLLYCPDGLQFVNQIERNEINLFRDKEGKFYARSTKVGGKEPKTPEKCVLLGKQGAAYAWELYSIMNVIGNEGYLRLLLGEFDEVLDRESKTLMQTMILSMRGPVDVELGSSATLKALEQDQRNIRSGLNNARMIQRYIGKVGDLVYNPCIDEHLDGIPFQKRDGFVCHSDGKNYRPTLEFGSFKKTITDRWDEYLGKVRETLPKHGSEEVRAVLDKECKAVKKEEGDGAVCPHGLKVTKVVPLYSAAIHEVLLEEHGDSKNEDKSLGLTSLLPGGIDQIGDAQRWSSGSFRNQYSDPYYRDRNIGRYGSTTGYRGFQGGMRDPYGYGIGMDRDFGAMGGDPYAGFGAGGAICNTPEMCFAKYQQIRQQMQLASASNPYTQYLNNQSTSQILANQGAILRALHGQYYSSPGGFEIGSGLATVPFAFGSIPQQAAIPGMMGMQQASLAAILNQFPNLPGASDLASPSTNVYLASSPTAVPSTKYLQHRGNVIEVVTSNPNPSGQKTSQVTQALAAQIGSNTNLEFLRNTEESHNQGPAQSYSLTNSNNQTISITCRCWGTNCEYDHVDGHSTWLRCDAGNNKFVDYHVSFTGRTSAKVNKSCVFDGGQKYCS